jgi:YfiH family protein
MMPPDAMLQANWPAPAQVRAFTTVRGGPGVSLPPFDRFNLGLRCGDEPRHASSNRERLTGEFQLPGAPRWLRQVHGVDVLRFDGPAERLSPVSEAEEPEADAAVTARPDVVLAILTADCMPVLFCNEEGSEVAAAHAGWRGLSGGILEATVKAMRSPPATLLAWLGPAAGPQAYEIGAEVRDAFLDADPAAAAAFTWTREDHWLVDLYLLARQRLAAAGVSKVHGGGLCTISDSQRFYSHRRDQRTGRMATVIFRAGS